MTLHPSATELLATALFALAVIHTFCVNRFARWAHDFPDTSVTAHLLHFLAETEIVFGIWAMALFAGITALAGSFHAAIDYIESLDFTEPKFVLVIMVVAATRPIVRLTETIILQVARRLPWQENISFYLAALVIGPLLGSFITEPAAMTLLAMVLKQRYFDRGISSRFAYATLGLLFVNVSIGGTLTHFAAPPVLMVATTWNWDVAFMLKTFGWRAAAACTVSTGLLAAFFWKELKAVPLEPEPESKIPAWLVIGHVLFLVLVVAFSHYPDVFFGVFMLFLGLVMSTPEHQDSLKLREGLLVGFFLAGLVTLGSLQAYWLKPLISNLQGGPLYFGAVALTAITDNAALTYLGSLVDGIPPELKYALVAGAVTGGGLTVIANAPNPAGLGILHDARVFKKNGVSPLGLFLGALLPTLVAIFFFWVVA